MRKWRNALVKRKSRAARLRRLRQRKWLASEQGQYSRARNNALQRGVEWLFTKDSWLKVWKDSGHFHERGRGAGCYQMARKGDCGPYAEWNVVIVRMESNACACLIANELAPVPRNPKFIDEVLAIL